MNYFTAAPNTFLPSVWNLLRVIFLAPRILRKVLDFTKICANIEGKIAYIGPPKNRRVLPQIFKEKNYRNNYF
jgi:hypothetical protein